MTKEQILQLILTDMDIFTNNINVSRTYVLYSNDELSIVDNTYTLTDPGERLFIVWKTNGSVFIEEKF